MRKPDIAQALEAVKAEHTVIVNISTVFNEKKGVVMIFGLGDDQLLHLWDISSGTWKVYRNDSE